MRLAREDARSRRTRLRHALAAIVVLAAGAALAQKGQVSQGPPNALQGFSQNRDQPVKIQADKLEVRDKDKIATFTGNVHVTQGDTEMRSRVLVVYYEDSGKAAGNAPAAKGEQRQAQPEPGLDRQSKLHGHERVHALLGQRPKRIDPLGGRPKDLRDLLDQHLGDVRSGLLAAHPGQPLAQILIEGLAAGRIKSRKGRGPQNWQGAAGVGPLHVGVRDGGLARGP